MNDESPLLSGLNEYQREAVIHFLGPILVLAGAGSGKTRVLTRRIAYLVQERGVDPASILAVTFTNKAANEMRERIHELIGKSASRAWVSTFHSTALRILRRQSVLLGYGADFVVYDADDSKSVMMRILKGRNIDTKKNPPQQYLKRIERYKNDYVGVEKALKKAQGMREFEVAEIYQAYQNELFMAGAMDFSDLLFNVVKVMDEHSDVRELYQRAFRFIMVDEFQDTNAIQYRFLRLLSQGHGNVLVVGDDDQSIYAFRGANPASMDDFRRDYNDARLIKLEENYRSTQIILNAAHGVIENNGSRMKKRLWTRGEGGELISTYVGYNEFDEARFVVRQIKNKLAEGVPEREIAIFYRTNAQSRALEESLVHAGVVYKVFGGLRFFDRKEIKDILAFIRFLVNPRDVQALIRIINTPPRGIGAKGIQGVLDLLADSGGDCLQALRQVSASNKAIGKFYSLIVELRSSMLSIKLGDFVGMIIEKTGYVQKLKELNDYSSQSRIENLKELEAISIGMENQFENSSDQISGLLDRAALMSSDEMVDLNDSDQTKGYVSLMTLHIAKGLEFDCVFLTGLESGLLPHYLAAATPDGIEEERRLTYVGITRARKKLFLTRARSRSFFSSFNSGASPEERYKGPSPFLAELPLGCLDAGSEDFVESMVYEEYVNDFDNGVNKFGGKKYISSGQHEQSNNVARQIYNQLDVLVMPANSLEVLALSEIKTGILVNHDIFGDGVIKEVEINVEKPDNSKIMVFFNNLNSAKRLVYGAARLRRME